MLRWLDDTTSLVRWCCDCGWRSHSLISLPALWVTTANKISDSARINYWLVNQQRMPRPLFTLWRCPTPDGTMYLKLKSHTSCLSKNAALVVSRDSRIIAIFWKWMLSEGDCRYGLPPTHYFWIMCAPDTETHRKACSKPRRHTLLFQRTIIQRIHYPAYKVTTRGRKHRT